MSFVYAVFLADGPQTRAELVARAQGFLKTDEAPDPKVKPDPRIAAFVQTMLARYPESHKLPDHKLDECPWAASPDIYEDRVLLAISGFTEREFPELIDALCREHGLVCVYVDMGDLIYAPPEVLKKPWWRFW